MYIPPLLELLVRYLYFELNTKDIIHNKVGTRKKTVNKINIKQIEEKMKDLQIKRGDTIMIHSSFKYINDTAENFIEFLMDYIGEQGNILMPTHPLLSKENDVLVYDIKNSPSTVGYLTEVFRNTDGVLRSEHPLSSVAAWGKDAEYLLKDNLNNKKPLPHGIYSPYYKMMQLNAKVLCIGVTARERATIKHVAEEVLDEDFLLNDLFIEKEIVIKNNNKFLKKVIVREFDLTKSQIFVAKYKIEKEWLNNNILIKSPINGVPFDIVDARKCVNYMINEAKRGNINYPYLARKGNKNMGLKN